MSETTIDLASAKYMSQAEGRQSFSCDRRTFFGTQNFQAIAMKEGLLVLRLLSKKAAKHNPFLEVLSMMMKSSMGHERGGALGGWAMGDMHGSSIADLECHETLENFTMETDEVIWSKARSRKGSMLLDYADIESVSIEPAGSLSTLAGVVQVRSSSRGTIKLEIDEHPELGLAIELFERRCGAITEVGFEMDDQMMYVARRG